MFAKINNHKVLKGSKEGRKMITYYKRPDEHVSEEEEMLDTDKVEDLLESEDEE